MRSVNAALIYTLSATATAGTLRSQIPARPTMADAVAYALRSSPDIITASLQIDSAAGERRIAGAIPNPSFTIAPGSPTQYTVNQAIDVGPNRLYRTRAASQGVAAVQLDRETVARQITFSVRQSFLDLLLAESVRDVVFAQDTIMRRLLASDSLRFAEGDLARRDLNTTELQFAHAEANLARAESAARTARIALQVLMGVPHPDTSFRVSGTLDYRPLEIPFDSLKEIALHERSDVRAAGVRVDQSQSLKSLAAAQLIPVPGIAGVYQQEPFSSGRNVALGLSLNLPVFYWFGGERQRAAAGLATAREAQRRATTATVADVDGAVNDFRAAQALAARYAGGLLAKARATVDMQRFAYEHGNASLLDLLSAVSAFGDTQTDYFTAVHDYQVAAYAIDRAVGREVTP